MAKLSKFELDPQASLEGKWFDIVLGDNYFQVKLARFRNSEFQAELDDMLIKGKSGENAGTELYVNHIIRDVKGLEGEDGKELKFSKELARRFMTDEKLEHIKFQILDHCSNFNNFLADEQERQAALKN